MGRTISFRLGSKNHKTLCPKCYQHVDPITCGFNNCEWRFMGMKQESDGQMKRVKNDWIKVDDNYYRFDPKASGTVKWDHIVIEARESIDDKRKITTKCNKQTIELFEKVKSNLKVSQSI